MSTPIGDSQYDGFLEALAPFSMGLNSCSATLDRRLNWRVHSKKLRPISHISSSYKVDWIGEEGFDVIAAMRMTTKHPENKKHILNIECTFQLHFHGDAPFLKEHVERFAQNELRVFVWPYFRQFVSDTTGRMGIRPVLLPITVKEDEADPGSPSEGASGESAASPSRPRSRQPRPNP